MDSGKVSGDNKKISEKEDLRKKAEDLGVLYLEDIPKNIKKDVLGLISEESSRKYKIVIFDRDGKKIKVAMVDPKDYDSLNVLRFIAEKENLETEVYLLSERDFESIVEKYSTAEKVVEDALQSIKGDQNRFSFAVRKENEFRDKESIQEAPVAKLVQVVIRHALDGRASDVHIEPIEDAYRVRFRVDGILHSSLNFPKEVGMAVVSHIKILSNLKIDEKRKPQDGRFQISDNGEIIDFRVSTLPLLSGEKLVMRVLNKNDQALDLEALGISKRDIGILLRKIKDSYGVILITGPTGSGKSTTLYALLEILNQEERNIITLEDPIEYYIDGINQSQIRPEIGYTFANGLRSVLRQDPNVIMVGEIRDTETAELVTHAALTGHLVFSTAHTNDCIGVIPRLVDMGIEPFLLSSSLRAVAAQRLVRKICSYCKKEIEVGESLRKKMKAELKNVEKLALEEIGVASLDDFKIYEGTGCEKCGNSGFLGRVAIFEILEVDGDIQEIISGQKNSEIEIRKEAERKNFVSMRQDGFIKVIQGMTTFSEVERVTDSGFAKTDD